MMSETEKEIDDFLKIFGTSLRHYTFGDTKKRAITAWNTRTPDPRVMKLVEALKDCIDAYEFCSDDPADRGWSVLDGAVIDARTALSAFNGDTNEQG